MYYCCTKINASCSPSNIDMLSPPPPPPLPWALQVPATDREGIELDENVAYHSRLSDSPKLELYSEAAASGSGTGPDTTGSTHTITLQENVAYIPNRNTAAA